MKLLAEAALLAASADEPVEQNFIRAHALAHVAQHGGSIEQAALRVFCNADGTYGATSMRWSARAPGTTRTNSPRPSSSARVSPMASTASRRGRTRC